MAFVLDALRGPIGKGVLIGAGGLALAGPIFNMGTIHIDALGGKPIYGWLTPYSDSRVNAAYALNNIGLDYGVALLAGCAVSSWAVNRFV